MVRIHAPEPPFPTGSWARWERNRLQNGHERVRFPHDPPTTQRAWSIGWALECHSSEAGSSPAARTTERTWYIGSALGFHPSDSSSILLVRTSRLLRLWVRIAGFQLAGAGFESRRRHQRIRPVSSTSRAPGLHPGGWEGRSLTGYHCRRLAQPVERLTLTQEVAGSSPAAATNGRFVQRLGRRVLSAQMVVQFHPRSPHAGVAQW